MKSQSQQTYQWTVSKTINEVPQVCSLLLEPKGVRPTFIPGQYLTVYLEDHGPREGKSYSISSCTHDPHLRLTVKEIGAFSKTLCARKAGSQLTTSAPYGFFYPEFDEVRDLSFIAGGIGIAPCMSIIESLVSQKYPKKISLFYSNRTRTDCVFKERLDELASTNPQFSAHYHITREPTFSPYISGRISDITIFDTIPKSTQTDFFICGSIDFTKNLWKNLVDSGIQKNQIYTEGFF